jgi:hypothetical protein
MPYMGGTSSGAPVNPRFYKMFQDYSIQLQENGQASPTYDEWYQQMIKNSQQMQAQAGQAQVPMLGYR